MDTLLCWMRKARAPVWKSTNGGFEHVAVVCFATALFAAVAVALLAIDVGQRIHRQRRRGRRTDLGAMLGTMQPRVAPHACVKSAKRWRSATIRRVGVLVACSTASCAGFACVRATSTRMDDASRARRTSGAHLEPLSGSAARSVELESGVLRAELLTVVRTYDRFEIETAK